MGIGHIVRGTLNNILDKEQELFNERMKICIDCKLYVPDGFGGAKCNPYLYLDPTTEETSRIPKLGYYRGCGCILGSKTRVREAHCPAKKW